MNEIKCGYKGADEKCERSASVFYVLKSFFSRITFEARCKTHEEWYDGGRRISVVSLTYGNISKEEFIEFIVAQVMES